MAPMQRGERRAPARPPVPHLPAVRGRLRARDHATGTAGGEVVRIRGDRDDVFSHGYLCPKGSALKQLHDDPDRLRTPLVSATAASSTRSRGTRRSPRSSAGCCRSSSAHGRDARRGLPRQPERAQPRRLLVRPRRCSRRSAPRNVFSASTVDQMPKQVCAGLMFGAALTIPVPDIDRTDYLLMLGANPFASNGSLVTAPDWPGRIEALQRPRRPARRRRPAPQPNRRGGRRAPLHPPRHRRVPAARPWSTSLFADGLVDLGAVARIRRRARRGARAPRRRRSRPRPSRRSPASTPTDDPPRSRASSRRRRRAAVYGRIGTTHAGVRHARVAGSSTCST